MKLKSQDADIFVPDSTPIEEALERTTHLCVAAHQDDTEIFAYSGIADCFNVPDKWFSSVIVTDGAGTPRAGVYTEFSDTQMQDIRKQEQRNAAGVGAYSVQIQLGYPSSKVKDPAFEGVCNDILEILLQTKPSVVYLHNPADKHDTHVATFLRALKALRALPPESRPEKVLACEVWRSLDWLDDNDKLPLDASRRTNLAAALLGVFDSQITGGKRYDLAAMGRRLANATFFTSHATDECDSTIYAMDITPLVTDPAMPVEKFTLDAIEKFKDDVAQRIRKFS